MFKGVLLDLGGVVYIGDAPVPGAVAALDRLREVGLPIRFLTNTTRSPRRELLAHLAGMGIAIADEELFTPAAAACAILRERQLTPHLLTDPRLAEDFAGLPEGTGTALLVGDAHEHFTYAALNAAYRALEDGAAFLALANNRSFRDADGGLSLDAGPFVAALAFAAEREPLVLGKPSPAFFHAALASMGASPGEAVMVGDDVESDVGGALAAGLAGVLVRTGKYREGDEAQIDPPPSHVAADLAAAAAWIIAH